MLITSKVGAAPGTTTLYYPYANGHHGDLSSGGLGMVVNDDWFMTGRTGRLRDPGYYSPSFNPNSGLGMVPDPMPISRSIGSEAQSGGFVESSNVPNDAELSTIYGYTPVHAGWAHMNGLSGSILGMMNEEAMAETVRLTKRQVTLQLIATTALASMALFTIISGLVRAAR